eukprot:gb/GEZN01007857.1/.p1 GENE.gb/GEZN01007857.1/~~gb/GEZN01007857.1/.p1  ORF type:complete len:207 (-),score=10.52 gb/GEZN01007857.1/:663-1283(-)
MIMAPRAVGPAFSTSLQSSSASPQVAQMPATSERASLVVTSPVLQVYSHAPVYSWECKGCGVVEMDARKGCCRCSVGFRRLPKDVSCCVAWFHNCRTHKSPPSVPENPVFQDGYRAHCAWEGCPNLHPGRLAAFYRALPRAVFPFDEVQRILFICPDCFPEFRKQVLKAVRLFPDNVFPLPPDNPAQAKVTSGHGRKSRHQRRRQR